MVDNSSSDGSAEMVVTDFPEVKLIHSGGNLGFAKANNIGIKSAKGKYLALVNSDVVVHPECFQNLIRFMGSHPDAGLIGPHVIGRDGKLQRTCRLLPSIWNTSCESFGLDTLFSRHSLFSGREMRHWKHDETVEVEVLSGCFWLARRDAVEKIGGLDERFFFYAEDVDWCKRFRDAGFKMWYVMDATATHFGGGSSSNAPLRYSVEMLRANLKYWEKYAGIPGQIVYHILSVFYHGLRFILRGLIHLIGGGKSEDFQYRYRENQACLRWLLTGKEPETPKKAAVAENILTSTKT